MSKELPLPLTPAAFPAMRAGSGLRSIATILAGSALVAVCAHVALPLCFTPVPLSLAPFAVLLLGPVAAPAAGRGHPGAYLAEGALGLPVFAPGPPMTGGLAHLLGPTGGYLMAYPAAAALAPCSGAPGADSAAALLSAAPATSNACCGALWLAVLTHASAQRPALAVLPFCPATRSRLWRPLRLPPASACAAAGPAASKQSHLQSAILERTLHREHPAIRTATQPP